MLTLVAYGQLNIENRKHYRIEGDLLDESFDFMVRDLSKYAVSLPMTPSNIENQKELSLKIVKAPILNPEHSRRSSTSTCIPRRTRTGSGDSEPIAIVETRRYPTKSRRRVVQE